MTKAKHYDTPGLPSISADFNKRLNAAAKAGEQDAITAAADRIAASLGSKQPAVTVNTNTTTSTASHHS